MSQRAMLVCGLTLVLGAAAVCEGGIVVLEDGHVFVGKIRSHETTLDTIVLHNPNGEGGRMEIERHRVRWHDDAADTLTSAYFRDHLDDELIGSHWTGLQQKEIAGRQDPEITGLDFDPRPLLTKPSLQALPVQKTGFAFRPPSDWTGSMHKEIVVFQAPKATRNGFTPRIHVFSVRSPDAAPDDQVSWIEQELTKLAGGKKRFAMRELHRPRQVSGGTNQRLLTDTQIDGRTVKAIRQVFFRDGRTYFFAGYVDGRDYERYKALIEASLDTLELDADRP